MKKEQFIKNLRYSLRKLKKDEREKYLAYYEKYTCFVVIGVTGMYMMDVFLRVCCILLGFFIIRCSISILIIEY